VTAGEYGVFKHGGTEFPLVSATTNSLLQDADPFLYAALDYFAAMLQTHMGTRLVAQATACGAPITAAVASSIPFPPGPYMTGDQLKFPLLAAYRVDEEFQERTATWTMNKTNVEVCYILPPLDAAQAEAMWPSLNAAARIIDNRTEQGVDPAYTPPFTGATAGSRVWLYAGVERIMCKRGRFGSWEAADGLVFPSYVVNLEVWERTMTHSSAFDDLTALNLDEDLVTAGESNVADFVQVNVDTDGT
jgi:hypothetical protein